MALRRIFEVDGDKFPEEPWVNRLPDLRQPVDETVKYLSRLENFPLLLTAHSRDVRPGVRVRFYQPSVTRVETEGMVFVVFPASLSESANPGPEHREVEVCNAFGFSLRESDLGWTWADLILFRGDAMPYALALLRTIALRFPSTRTEIYRICADLEALTKLECQPAKVEGQPAEVEAERVTPRGKIGRKRVEQSLGWKRKEKAVLVYRWKVDVEGLKPGEALAQIDDAYGYPPSSVRRWHEEKVSKSKRLTKEPVVP